MPTTGEGLLQSYWQAGSRAAGNALSDIEGIWGGVQQGGAKGIEMAATSAAKLGTQAKLLSPSAGTLAGEASYAGNIVADLQRGGVSGDVGAAANAAALYGLAGTKGIPGVMAAGQLPGASTATAIAAPLASALSIYNFARNWASGATGADAIQGAQMGATIGTEFLPGLGTLLGALAGGAFGAVTSAFGGGETSQEALMSRSIDQQLQGATPAQRAQALSTLSPAQSVQTIQGFMNAHDNSPVHSEAIEQVFGKNGVNNMLGQMMPAINQAIASGKVAANATPQQIYSQVVAPWLQSKGASVNPNQKDVHGNPEGQNLIDAITNTIGQWQSGQLTSQSNVGVGGQTLNIPAFAAGGTGQMAPQSQMTLQQAMQPQMQAFNSLALLMGTGGGTW